MRALVSGATGFVGSHLAEALRSRGDEGTALVRSPSKAAALGPLGVRVVSGDLDDPASLARAVEGHDVPRIYLRERALTKGYAVVRRTRYGLRQVTRK